MYQTDLSQWLPVIGYIIFLLTITTLVISRSRKKRVTLI